MTRVRNHIIAFFILSGFIVSCIQAKHDIGIKPLNVKNSKEISLNENPKETLAVKELKINSSDERDVAAKAADEHEALFAESRYPSAATCGTCHPKHYKEWSVSQHSYSQLSPIYISLNNKINELTSGSNGDFCFRCHNQVGSNMGETPFISNLERHPTSREGITCVVCHRISKTYNKVSGRLALEEGGLLEPVYGPTGNAEMKEVLSNPDKFRVVTKEGRGRKIHKEVKQFTTLSSPTFCAVCHDVTLFNGFRLEEAFSEYRLSPAAEEGITCQDCHMGKIQGIPSGYEEGAAANVGGVLTKKRKLTNHTFAGPDYSLIHPGIFPHNSEAQEMATIEEWLKFDYKEGWGTDEFEDNVPDEKKFPTRWSSVDDRYDAREIIDHQLNRLKEVRKLRLEVLRNGYKIENIEVKKASLEGIELTIKVKNSTNGHNAPTGFTGERMVWLEVIVTNLKGNVIFKSGDTDPNGDLRDQESSYVHNAELPLDKQLFNLQSRFVVQNLRGGVRERVIPIPYPLTTIPFVRPSINSLVLSGEPQTERNHRRGIEPNGYRLADYEIDKKLLTGKGKYKIQIKLNSQMVPVNLVDAIQDVGFDYGMSAREIGDALVDGRDVLWEKVIEVDVEE
jgi:nitrate/TMAO reductase-like tetraheme cytochrome c subunit